MKVRTRMAPSPTGDYHIGHVRTALYNYAFAKKSGGEFIIRIEDTDRTRFVEGAVDRILRDLTDYGLLWDKGPYVQSERLDIYKKYINQLLESGHAYRCFCSSERINELREKQRNQKIPPKYDKNCLRLSANEIQKKIDDGATYVVRLNVPADEVIEFSDAVYGDLTFDSNDVDDQVLIKSDGFPTYHFAVVVDDHLMGITHVLRGNDWLPSVPKHVLLYKFFGWEMPVHAHLPNIKEKDGSKKLSKRFGSVFARQFLEEGYLPEALLNFLMLLGWNPGNDQEIYSLEEFTKKFSLERVHKTDLVSFDRAKLLWINGYYIRNMAPNALWEKIKVWSERNNIDLGFDSNNVDSNKITKVVTLVSERMKILGEFPFLVSYFFNEFDLNVELLRKYAGEKTRDVLERFVSLYEACLDENWSASYLDEISHDLIKSKGYRPKEAFMTVRVAVSGVATTPPLFDTLEALGKETSLKRLKTALLEIEKAS